MKRDAEHITPALLSAVAEKSVPLAELLLRVYDHLLQVCPECARTVTRLTESQDWDSNVTGLWNSMDLSRIHRRLEAELHHVKALRIRARRERDDLLRIDRDERVSVISRDQEHFVNPMLAIQLVEESHSKILSDPRAAEHLAELAEEIAIRLPASDYPSDLARDLEIRARAHRANAMRAANDLLAAERMIQPLLDEVRESSDPLLRGELLALAGMLRKDQRRFSEAAALVAQAEGNFRSAEDLHLVGKTIVGKATLLEAMGEPEQAIAALREAVSLIDSEREPYLQLCAGHNLAWHLTSLERYVEAAAVYREHRPLYGEFPDRLQLRRRWLEGRLAYGTGSPGRAEALFIEVRDGFLKYGLSYYAALASLDLALLYSRQGRSAELKDLATEMHATFQAHGIHREALAALAFFRQAVARDAVTHEMIREICSYLEAARDNPELRFEPSSS